MSIATAGPHPPLASIWPEERLRDEPPMDERALAAHKAQLRWQLEQMQHPEPEQPMGDDDWPTERKGEGSHSKPF